MYKLITKAFIAVVLLMASLNSYADYLLSAGDTIRISVYGEEDLSFDELLIDNRETFDYPYLGSIKTEFKSLRVIQDTITQGLKDGYLLDPKVNVSIVKYRNIFVNGVVNKPGAYEYQPGLTVEKAIALAGGFLARYRKTKGIYVTTDFEVKNKSQEEIKRLLKNKETADLTSTVNPGDSVYVVSSFW